MPQTAAPKQAFIVVSTGQNLANLPPVLECAEPGDVVVWVESKEAQQGQWSEGARTVLEKHELTTREPSIAVEDINDPRNVAECLKPVITQLAPGYFLNLIANGGQKMTPIGLLDACRKLESVVSFRTLYGHPKPAELWVFDGIMIHPPQRRPYHRHRLDLHDVLTARNLVLMQPREPLPLHGPIPGTDERYGIEKEFTAAVHADYHRYHTKPARQSELAPSFAEVLDFERNGALSEHYDAWLKSLVAAVKSGYALGRKPGARPDAPFQALKDGMAGKPLLLESIFQTTQKLIKRAVTIKAKAQGDADAPSVDLGQTFERAVATRLLRYLQDHPEFGLVVQSVWTDVHVARKSSQEQEMAQWDIVVLFKSGLLLSIECKSFAAEQKDLDARLLNLLRAGSQAEMLICGPVYTDFAAEPWFAAMHKLKGKVGKEFLPFTLASQPETYRLPNQRPDSPEHFCESFESALDRYLGAFVPK